MHVTRQTVQLGDEQRCACLFGVGQRTRQLRAVSALAALNLCVFSDDVVTLHCVLLGLKAKTRLALTLS